MKKTKKTYVYIDTRLDTFVPFYVGIGSHGRTQIDKRNKRHANISQKHGAIRVIAYETSTWDDARHCEIWLIKTLRTRDHFGGANFTDGGEGVPGRTWTPKQRKKQSEAQKAARKRPETIQKHKIAAADPVIKTKRSESQKIAQARPDTKGRHRAAMKRATNTQERRQRQSEISKRTYENESLRNRYSKPITQLDPFSLMIIRTFCLISLAARTTGIPGGNISRAANRCKGTAGGYCWRFTA